MKNSVGRIFKVFSAILLVAVLISAFSSANFAHAQARRKSYAMCVVNAKVIGVNQEVLVLVGMAFPTAYPQTGWKGLYLYVERPDGIVEKLGPFDTDTTGCTGVTYTPRMVGKYYFQTYFPEQIVEVATAGIPAGTILEESWSEKVELIVQEEPIKYYPGFQLPTEFWTRPINTQLREWAHIAGNWLGPMPNLYNPYTQAPETAHILWVKPLITGGLVGQPYDYYGFHTGDAYEGLMMMRAPPVIINGILFYNQYPANYHIQTLIAVDLRTGEEIWRRNGTRVSLGQVLSYNTRNQMGCHAYIWEVVGTTWRAYHPFTGAWMYTMTNVPAGFVFGTFAANTVYGPNGEILTYLINTAQGWLALWNSTAIPALFGGQDYANRYLWEQWRPWGKTVDARGSCPKTPETPMGISGISWNVSIPRGLPGSILAVVGDRIIGGSITSDIVRVWAVSIEPGRRGQLIFNTTWTPPEPGQQRLSWVGASRDDGVFVIRIQEGRCYYGFSIDTGAKIWGPTEPEGQLNIWVGTVPRIAYGKLFSAGYDGVLYCYDLKTGKRLWAYEAVDPYHEILWSYNWPIHIGAIADRKIYIYHMEHSAIEPKPRGAPLICVDVDTGKEVWRISFRETYWGSDPAIADGILVILNTYDNCIYAFGKGPTATTVTVQDDSVKLGDTIVIKGMVIDISPGTKDYRIALRFPSGVPAIADEDMSRWMEYVYMQFPPRPTDVKGVWVKLDAINVYTGEYLDIGGTHTDSAGFYTVMWTPPKEGLWKIIASFPGSKGYWPSFAQTSIAVVAPPTQPTPASPEQVQTVQSLIEALGPQITMLLAILIALVIMAMVASIYSIFINRRLMKSLERR
ncbi:MAG: PQQ-binding-like beta-propeller repeat protein [Candidatus Bathyarchaeia archaeon]